MVFLSSDYYKVKELIKVIGGRVFIGYGLSRKSSKFKILRDE